MIYIFCKKCSFSNDLILYVKWEEESINVKRDVAVFEGKKQLHIADAMVYLCAKNRIINRSKVKVNILYEIFYILY